MTYARKSLISLDDTPYYHVVARCVRRAWLWGFDEYAGKDYSHRKEWVLGRLRYLSQVFAIEICAYAVMSNHYHLVLYVDARRAGGWSEVEVMRRWSQLFRLPELVQRYRDQAEDLTAAEGEHARKLISTWRTRLHEVSWFMRALNEHLARRANAEDECKGRFWEGRFKSQALLDEAGLLTAMAYVDLNPVRAGIAKAPEDSEFTSIYARIQQRQKRGLRPSGSVRLRKFSQEGSPEALPFKFEDYLELVDWSGRRVRLDKRGHIDARLPPILARLDVDGDAWQAAMRPGKHSFGRALGRLERLRQHAKHLKQSWIRGQRACERLYG